LLPKPKNITVRAFSFSQQVRTQKAREQFLKAMEKNPNWAAPHLGLGQTFFFEKKPN
jgi:hypothetical protein